VPSGALALALATTVVHRPAARPPGKDTLPINMSCVVMVGSTER
jgi:hypothetical protein